jgi:cytochrome c oxidase subunit 2
MLDDKERAAREQKGIPSPRLLSGDNEVVVPVNKVVHVLVTSNDVIHNWTMQSFGSKIDAVPGRITATWFQAEKEGIYYGQCSELCGLNHAFMPINVRVVSEAVFNEWVAAMQAKDKKKAREILDKVAIEQAAATKVAQDAAPQTN